MAEKKKKKKEADDVLGDCNSEINLGAPKTEQGKL